MRVTQMSQLCLESITVEVKPARWSLPMSPGCSLMSSHAIGLMSVGTRKELELCGVLQGLHSFLWADIGWEVCRWAHGNQPDPGASLSSLSLLHVVLRVAGCPPVSIGSHLLCTFYLQALALNQRRGTLRIDNVHLYKIDDRNPSFCPPAAPVCRCPRRWTFCPSGASASMVERGGAGRSRRPSGSLW